MPLFGRTSKDDRDDASDDPQDAPPDTDDEDPEYPDAFGARPPLGDSLLVSRDETDALLAALDAMRDDCVLCDVVIAVRGRRFPAHRVVLCGVSRWLRALLLLDGGAEPAARGADAGVVALDDDEVDADAFGAVLDYVYGRPLRLALGEGAEGEGGEARLENVLRVLRALEMGDAELRVWGLLLARVDVAHAAFLHGLADRLGCEPLKHAAWECLRRAREEYDQDPAALLRDAVEHGARDRLDRALRGRGGEPVHLPPCDALFTTAEWRAHLTEFYRKYNMTKMKDVEPLLVQFRGNETKLFESVRSERERHRDADAPTR